MALTPDDVMQHYCHCSRPHFTSSLRVVMLVSFLCRLCSIFILRAAVVYITRLKVIREAAVIDYNL